MAGSRREKLGSIFSRMTGLMRAGALKEEDRPIWYDIVKALPPKPVPPQREIKNLLYPEDFIRVHFYKTFVETGVTVLTNEKMKSVPQRFVDKYLELQKQNLVPAEQLFDETARILREEGVKLITHEEKQALDMAKTESRRAAKDFEYNTSSVKPVQGRRSDKAPEVERSSEPKVDLDDLFKDNR